MCAVLPGKGRRRQGLSYPSRRFDDHPHCLHRKLLYYSENPR